MKFNFYGFSNNAVHVSCFCGEYGGAIEMNTVFLVDAVLGYGRLVRIFQTDVAFMFFQSGVDGVASLPNVDFATLIRSSETSVLIRATRRHLPEDDNHHSHRRGNLKSYML
jgi:hypothetical protein